MSLLLTLAGWGGLIALLLVLVFYKRSQGYKALSKSEERFRSLVETASDWIWEMDAAGRYTYASSRVQDLLGYTPQEVLGKSPLDLMVPAEAELIAEKFKRIIENHLPFHLLKNINLHRDGREVVFETSGLPFFDKNGKLAGYRGVDRDISNRHKAQDSLHMALHGLDSSISGITMADLSGNVTYANDAFQSMWGVDSPYKFIGRPAFDLWENSEQAQSILPALSTRGTWSGELVGVRADGSRFFTQASAFLVRNRSGDPLCLMGSYLDISGRKEAERAHRESEDKLNAMLQSIVDPVSMIDQSLHILWANDTAKQLLGEDLVGKKCCETFHRCSRSCDPSTCSVMGCFEDGQLRENQHPWTSPDGTTHFFHCTTNVALRDSDGHPTAVLTVSRDITAIKQAQEELHLAKYAMDSSLAPIVMTDLQGRLSYVNKAFVDMGGYVCAEEVLGKDSRILFQDPAVALVLRQALDKKGEWRGELLAKLKDEAPIDVEVLSYEVRNPAGEPLGSMTSFLDVTEKKKAEQEIRRLAYFDDLTGLPNRTLLRDHMDLALSSSRRSGKFVAVLLLDLDNFKQINDTLGHAKGDLMLQQVAQRLRSEIRHCDTVARWGGDEFVLLLTEFSNENAIAGIACKVMELLSEQPYDLQGSEVFSSASVGIALFPQNGTDAETLLTHADNAMYEVKKDGRNDYHFFSEQMHQKATERHRLDGSLRRALRQEEFFLVYQPQIDLATGRIVGLEALVRWQDPENGLVSPAEFIPLAEETGLIRPLGEWILRTACGQSALWQRAGRGPLRIAVNLSAQQFRQPDLVERIEAVLQETGLDACLLELELTESVFMENMEAAVEVLVDLKARGIQIAIDDFGTGFSSLSYLKNFPIDRIKIAQEFVRDIPTDSNDMAIVKATISMAKSLGLKLIAEGVETLEQLEFLRQQGCREMQGYYFSRPLEADKVADYCVGETYQAAISATSEVSAPQRSPVA